jgi:hypothetical protein
MQFLWKKLERIVGFRVVFYIGFLVGVLKGENDGYVSELIL